MVPDLNFARGYLHRAADALEAGRLAEAGQALREAVRRQLYAELQWNDCLPESADDQTPPRALLDVQRSAGLVGDLDYRIIRAMLRMAKVAARVDADQRGQFVAEQLRQFIQLWHTAIDNEPCLQPANMRGAPEPVASLEDVDDDPADWWKGGAR